MRKTFDKQFKIATVKLVLEDNMAVADATKALSIHYNSLYRWISEYSTERALFPAMGLRSILVSMKLKSCDREITS